MAGIRSGFSVPPRGVDERLVKGILALTLMFFSVYSLTSRTTWTWRPTGSRGCSDAGSWPACSAAVRNERRSASSLWVSAALVGGAVPRDLAAHFLLASALIGMAGYWMAGLWVPLVTRYYLLSLPGTLVATLLGRVIHRRMQEHDFIRYVYFGLLVLGIALLGQSLWI